MKRFISLTGMIVFNTIEGYDKYVADIAEWTTQCDDGKLRFDNLTDANNFFRESKTIVFTPGCVDQNNNNKYLVSLLADDDAYDINIEKTIIRYDSDDGNLICGEFSNGYMWNKEFSTYEDFINLFGKSVIDNIFGNKNNFEVAYVLNEYEGSPLSELRELVIGWSNETLFHINHINITKTERNFINIKFRDHYNTECLIGESSTANIDTLWLGVKVTPKIMCKDAKAVGITIPDNAEIIDGVPVGWMEYPVDDNALLSGDMLVTKETAIFLVDALNVFIETGRLEGVKRPVII